MFFLLMGDLTSLLMILFHADGPKQGNKENVSSSFLYSYTQSDAVI